MYKAFIEPDLKGAHLRVYNTFNPFSGELWVAAGLLAEWMSCCCWAEEAGSGEAPPLQSPRQQQMVSRAALLVSLPPCLFPNHVQAS